MMDKLERGLTYSGLEQFMNCERKYYYDYIEQRPREPSPIFCQGIIYHKAIELIIKGKDVLTSWREAIEYVKQTKDWFELPDTFENHIDRNLDALNKLILRRLDIEINKVEFRIAEPLRGRIDCVSKTTPIIDRHGKIVDTKEGACVIDFKLKHNARTRRKLDAAYHTAQTPLYCLGAGIRNASLVEIPADSALSIRSSVAEFSSEQLERWSRYFLSQRRTMVSRGSQEENYRLADPTSPLCSIQWCPHFLNCPGGLNYVRS